MLLASLSKYIGLDDSCPINPEKIACFYRKDDEICLTLASVDSAYGRLLRDFPHRGRSNNLVTETVFDLENKTLCSSQSPKKGVNILFAVSQALVKATTSTKSQVKARPTLSVSFFIPTILTLTLLGRLYLKLMAMAKLTTSLEQVPLSEF